MISRSFKFLIIISFILMITNLFAQVSSDPLMEAYDLYKAGKYAESLEKCRALIKLEPDYPAAIFLLSKIYFNLGELDSARNYIDKAISLDPANQEFRKERENMSNFISKLAEASRLYNNAKYEEAEKIYLEIIKLNPNFADSYYLLARVYVKLGKYKEAKVYFTKALELKPDEKKYLDNYNAIVKQLLYEGNQLQKSRDYRGAIEKFKNAISLKPDDYLAYYLTSVVYLLIKDYDSTFKYIHKAIELNKEYPKAYLVKGKAHYYKGEYQKAIESFKMALEIDPEYVDALKNLGIVYYKMRNLDEALKYYFEALKHEKNDANIYENIGAILNEQKKYEESIKYLKKAVELDPRDNGSWLRLAQAYNFLGLPEKAKETVNRALQIKPRWAPALIELGLAEKALGNKSAAKQAFLMAARDPRYKKYAEYELQRLK
ncbi:MAG: tetratricopeptide repeat protein [Candidatus Marinimicrobia bacterium]|nr:tetratricopeptide repeat protein [Candidatus Neomarinimicrobiota bacterium]